MVLPCCAYLTASLSSGTFTVNGGTFTVVDTISIWAEASVDFVTSCEIFNDTDEGKFEPATVMNRGAIA